MGPGKGVRGAVHRRVIGKSMALSTIHSALLPYKAIMRDIVPDRALLQCLNLSGTPPVFVIWGRSGGPSKSMYSKDAGISETDGKN